MSVMSSIILTKKFIYADSMKKQKNGRKENIALRKAALFFGGVINLSKKLQLDNSQVYRWLYKERQIPIKDALQIEILTKGKIKAEELRPDLRWPSSLNNKES